MSLVPYTSRDSREIVLRHNDAVVVRDPHSKQLNLRDASNIHSSAAGGANLSECPLCHQSIRSQSPERDGRSAHRSDSFVSPEYFRMLQAELDSSDDDHYPPSSPIRRLVQPAYFSGSSDTPSIAVEDAEFVASTPAHNSEAQGIKKDAFSPGYYKKFFTEEKVLGRGGKGVVYLVKHELDSVSLGHFACKRVPVGDDHAWLEKVLIEVQLLQSLSHPNLVSYRHVWLEDFQPNRFGPSLPCAFILQQYCNAGDLLHYVIGDRPAAMSPKEQLKDQMRRRSKTNSDRPDLPSITRGLSFDKIYSFFRDIASGLAHLHQENYIHRDLKPSNCLLHNNGNETKCLISDFGEVQPENVIRKSTGATGTISYCAPEVLRRDATGRYGEFSTKSDIFSLGMILYFMCFGRLPYSSADAIQEELEDLDVLRAEISTWSGFRDERKERPELPDQLYEFLRRLLSINPVERPSAAEILQALNTGQGLDHPPRVGRSNSIDHGLGIRIGRRIQNLDSPAPGTPVGLRSTSSAYIEDANEDNQSPPPTKQEHEHQRDSRVIVDGPNQARDGSLTPTQHLLLPPPATPFDAIRHSMFIYRHQAMRWLAGNSQASIFVAKLLIFITKAYSLIQPCTPAATNPLVAYPLLLLAAVDVSMRQRHQWHLTVFLSVLHFFAIAVAVKTQALCLPERKIWE